MQNKLKLFVFTVAVCCVIATVNSNVINDIRLSGDEYDGKRYSVLSTSRFGNNNSFV